MRYLAFITFSILLVCLAFFAQQVAIGQTDCAEFTSVPTDGGGNVCVLKSPEIAVSFGKGMKTTLTAKNSWEKSHRVQFSWILFAPPSTTRKNVVAYYSSDSFSGSAPARSVWLDPNQTNTTTLKPAGICGTEWCQEPDMSAVVSGFLVFGFIADSPEVLRALKAPVLEVVNEETRLVTAVTFQSPPTTTISAELVAGEIQISWRTVTDTPIVKVYRDGEFFSNQSTSGSATDWAGSKGSHEYCVRGVTADWTETPNLACTTVVVP